MADGFDAEQLTAIQEALTAAGAQGHLISKFLGTVQSAQGEAFKVDKTWLTSASVMFDAVYVPGGSQSMATLKANPDVEHFVQEAFRHGKAIAATGDGMALLQSLEFRGIALSKGALQNDQGVITAEIASHGSEVGSAFVEAIGQHRFWTRMPVDKFVPGG